nr:hypothetical protein [Tanacetum cinerariifolium]
MSSIGINRRLHMEGENTINVDRTFTNFARCKYHKRGRMVNESYHSRVNHSTNIVPKAVLTRIGLKPINTVRPVNLKSTRSLDKLIGSQITDKSKRVLGYVSYNVVPPPHTKRFSPLRIDLSYTGLTEFDKPSVESYAVKPIEMVTQISSVKISEPVKENTDAPIIKDWESKEEDEVESPPEIERKTVKPSVDKVEVDIPKQNDKPARRPVKYA